jgi:GAF domain-containing protein
LLSVIEDQKRTEEALHRQNAYLTALQETTLDLISQLDLNTLFENIVKRAALLTGTSAGFLDMVEAATGQLRRRVGLGALAESLQYAVQPGEGIAGVVWQTGKPLANNDYDSWSGCINEFSRGKLGAVIGVPLLSGDQVLGVLGLAYDRETRRTFDQEAVELLAQFARLATIASPRTVRQAGHDRHRKCASVRGCPAGTGRAQTR